MVKKTSFSPCDSIQEAIFGNLEKLYLWWGEKVATYPIWVTLMCITFAGLSSLGLLVMTQETAGIELWTPRDSDFYQNNQWIVDNFPTNRRVQQLMLVTNDPLENILTQENLKLLLEIKKNLTLLKVENVGKNDICIKSSPCNDCFEIGLHFFWSNLTSCDPKAIEANMEKTENIIDHLNWALKNYPNLVDVEKVLGGISKDENGEINSGNALVIVFFHEFIENSEITLEEHKKWEQMYLDYLNNLELENGLKVVPYAEISYRNEMDKAVGGDIQILSLGFVIVFIFVILNLGKFNSVEQRAYLAMVGIATIGLGIITSYGISGLFGFPYTPMNSILPFLLLGIGIDDMFVIMQSFNNIKDPEELAQPLPKRFGLALKHAGVAISTTSLTNLLAFGIGATTILPALRSFCLYAALGITFVFTYMLTFFLAFFNLDQRRLESLRDSCLFCLKHDEWKANECSQKSLLETVFAKYAQVLVMWPFKALVLFITLALLATGSYGLSLLRSEFKLENFLNEGTYLRDFIELSSERFPSGGINGHIWVGQKPFIHQYILELNELITEASRLNESSLSAGGISSFLPDFIQHVQKAEDDKLYPLTSKLMKKSTFDSHLRNFLKGPQGQPWLSSFLFQTPFDPQSPKMPEIKAITFAYTHRQFESSVGYIKAMNDLFDVVDNFQDRIDGLRGKLFAFSPNYYNYVTIEIITEELVQNIAMASICIFMVTLLLLTDFLASLMVLLSVALTLIDMAGFMHFWGLTIDTASAILLTVAMGLAVDYGAHIAHFFMTIGGTRNERIQATLVNMGAAIFNGGFSTFLAFVLLITSNSYIFKTFFKIFFLVVSLGLYHGLVFLPVLLSLLGPASHAKRETKGTKKKKKKSKVAPTEIKDAWTSTTSLSNKD